jgi:MarR family transcriptional regulator, lower aerobic nicotinate degradation pathway regulator
VFFAIDHMALVRTVAIGLAIEKIDKLRHHRATFLGSAEMPVARNSKRNALPPMRLADIYEAPGHLIRRSQQISVAIFYEEFERFDVTPVQYAALVAIREHPGMDQRTLVDQIAIDRSTIGSMLATLEDRALIARVTPKDNRRVKQLYITRDGDHLLQASREHIYRVQERILAPLSHKERKLFIQLLSRLVHINNNLSRAPLKVVPKTANASKRD